MDITSYKSGPDYIDPMFHKKVIGVPSRNLDTFFSNEQEICSQLARSSNAVIEGVMGLYDGIRGVREEGSSYHLAALTGTPVILIPDVHGMGRTLLAVLAGICSYDWLGLIRGVILNRTSKNLFEQMAPMIERELSIKALGYIPKLRGLNLESRHLGLKLPEEAVHLREQVELVEDTMEQTVDIEAIVRIMEAAAPLTLQEKSTAVYSEWQLIPEIPANLAIADKATRPLRLAVARDEAFCFYYEANLDLLASYGAELVEFSPIHDEHLPEGISGLLLGGGYPELAAGRLGRNETIKAHDFHYYDSENNGADCVAVKPVTGRRWECIHQGENHLWGFAHLYYPSCREMVERFVEQMNQ